MSKTDCFGKTRLAHHQEPESNFIIIIISISIITIIVPLQVSKASVVPLAKATSASCGAKAAACADLAKLADKISKEQGSFGTAAGVCLPFGCMEAIIQVPYLSVHLCGVL